MYRVYPIDPQDPHSPYLAVCLRYALFENAKAAAWVVWVVKARQVDAVITALADVFNIAWLPL